MDNMSFEPKLPSQRSLEISKIYAQEVGRAARDENGSLYLAADDRLPTKEEYLAMCNEFLGTENILPDGLLKARLDFIKQDSHLKQHFQPGRKIQLAVIPFSGNGIRLDPDGIKDGDYLRTLVVMEEKDEFGNVLSSKTVGGFSFYRNEVHKLLPAEFTECSFVVPSYSSNGPYTVTDAEREIIMTEYERALRKLQELLKGFVP